MSLNQSLAVFGLKYIKSSADVLMEDVSIIKIQQKLMLERLEEELSDYLLLLDQQKRQ